MKHHNNEHNSFSHAFDSLTSRLFTKKRKKRNVLKYCSRMEEKKKRENNIKHVSNLVKMKQY